MIEAKRAAGTEHARAGGPPPGVAGGPPPGVTGGPPPGVGNPIEARTSGFEGREQLLGQAVAIAIRTLSDAVPYQHEINDALVKMHLAHVQFAKNQGLLKEVVADDVERMKPMLLRMKAAVEKTGNQEIALIGMFDRTACHYQLCLDSVTEPGRRVFKAPYGLVLEMGRRIGQFDLTEEEIHEVWTKPRFHGYAAVVGIRLKVSDLGPDRKITVELAD
jgi:hypothetical protein